MNSHSTGWLAPAKLNLFLHITGRRADGYHLLQTLFQFLDYGDVLDYELRDDTRIERPEGPAGVAPEDDLAVKAARLLQRRTGSRRGVSIHLRKILPLEAGLGGGSSDAATTLVALNRLWGTGLNETELMALAQELGADVPVFVGGKAAWAEGIGEKLTPLEPPELWYLVLEPACRVSTGEIFQAPELTRNSAPITISGFRSAGTRNDFEPVVRKRHPEVAAVLDWLAAHASGARLTGSGACVFAPFAAQQDAVRVQAVLPGGWKGFVAKGCNRSPLLSRLAEEG